MPPRFSVVIPTRHRDDLLARCLAPLAPGAQTLAADRYEVIVSDDGSESSAERIVTERFPWARWVAGPRRGPAANRNSGVRHARGEYIAFTDDDCVPSRGWLAAFDAAVVPGLSVYEGRTTCVDGVHSPRYHAPTNLDGGWLWSCNMVVRRAHFLEAGGFDEGFPYPHMEDTELRERLKALGHTLTWVPDAVIDHPPRKLAWGAALGRMCESEVYFFETRGRPVGAVRHLSRLARFRAVNILRAPLGLDTLSAAASTAAEILYVSTKISAWKRKYSVVHTG